MIAQWYIARGKQKLGPFSFRELKELARTGVVLPVDMVIEDGTQKWRSASEVEDLFWRASEDVIVGIPLSAVSTNGLSQTTPAPSSEEPGVDDPLFHAPCPASAAAPANRQRIEIVEKVEADPAPSLNPSPSVPPPTQPALTAASPELPTPSLYPAPASPPSAGPEGNDNGDGHVAQPRASRGSGEAIDPTPGQSEGAQQKLPTIRKPIASWKRLLKWAAAAAGLSAALGLLGDFLRPLAPFNLIGLLAAGGLAVSLIVARVKRSEALGPSFGAACTISAVSAIGFATWWAIAHFEGSREKGYLAEHSRMIGRLQFVLLFKAEGEEFEGDWSFCLEDTAGMSNSELHLKDGKMNWDVQFAKPGPRFRVEAEYRFTKAGSLYGIITKIRGRAPEARQQPVVGDTFSFRCQSDEQGMRLSELRGKGFEDFRNVVEGDYGRKE